MNEWTCIAGVAAALYMFHKVYIVVTVYVGDESGSLRDKLIFVREIYTAVQGGWARAGAFVLGLAVLMKGTTKVLFITAGIGLATVVVGATCPSLLQTIFEFIAKRFFP